MPVYLYKCKCGLKKEVDHSMNEKPEVGCSCGKAMRKSLTGGAGSFMNAMTPSKYYKEDRLRKKKNADLSVRQLKRYGGQNKLAPNVDGVEVSSWKDAEKLAAEKGYSTDAYKVKAAEEKNSNNSSGIDEAKLKKLEDQAKAVY